MMPFFIAKSRKSVGIAILLTFLFGPIGLFYASVAGGLIMTFMPIVLFVLLVVGLAQDNSLLFGWSLGLLIAFGLTFWLINMIWAVISVRSYNQAIQEEARRQFELWTASQATNPSQVIVNITEKVSERNLPSQRVSLEGSAKPNLQQWLKNNPGRSINDYFSKFGR